MPHSLRTERLVMRAPTLRDGHGLAHAVNHYDVLRNTGTWAFPTSPEYARFRIARSLGFDPQEEAYFVILYGETIIGHASLWHRHGTNYEIGYMIGKPWWGQGLGGEIVQALCIHGFRALPMGEVMGNVFIDNPVSMRVLKKIGFQYKGSALPGWSITRNAYTPLSTFVLTRERFKP